MKRMLLIVSLVCSFTLSGCETSRNLYRAATTSVSEQTATQLIVNAEKTTIIAKDSIDTFLKLERQNDAAYRQISPKIHQYAEYLRAPVVFEGVTIPRGVSFLKSARNATKAFKYNRTSENEANLRTAYQTLQAVLSEIRRYSSVSLDTAAHATPTPNPTPAL